MNTSTLARLITAAGLGMSLTLLGGCSDKGPADPKADAHDHADHDHADHDHADHDHDHSDHSDHDHGDHDDHSGHDHADHDHDTASTGGTMMDQAQDTINNAANAMADMPHVYPGVLGEITMLPEANNPASALKIHHTQIPNFRSSDGSIKVNSKGFPGMMSMTMSFPLADGVSVEGFEVNDKIMFTFEVIWDGARPSWEVTKIEKLDPSTEIDFTNKTEELLKNAAQDAMDNMPGHDGP